MRILYYTLYNKLYIDRQIYNKRAILFHFISAFAMLHARDQEARRDRDPVQNLWAHIQNKRKLLLLFF